MLLGALAGARGLRLVRPRRRRRWSTWPGVPVFAFTGLLMPGLQGLMTRRVAPHAAGPAPGRQPEPRWASSSIIGPVIFGEVFAWSLRHEGLHLPGLAIYLAAGLLALAFLLALRRGAPAESATDLRATFAIIAPETVGSVRRFVSGDLTCARLAS